MFPNTFHTARLILRPVVPEDASAIFNSYAQDREVTRFLTWRPHQSRAETDAYIARCTATPPDVGRTYVLVDQRNHTVRGALDLRQAARHRVELGYVLEKTYWGQGLITEAVTEVAAWTLAQSMIFRVGAVCDVENIGSARVMEKAGLTREGLLRRWLVHPNIGDQPRDCFSYARAR